MFSSIALGMMHNAYVLCSFYICSKILLVLCTWYTAMSLEIEQNYEKNHVFDRRPLSLVHYFQDILKWIRQLRETYYSKGIFKQTEFTRCPRMKWITFHDINNWLDKCIFYEMMRSSTWGATDTVRIAKRGSRVAMNRQKSSSCQRRRFHTDARALTQTTSSPGFILGRGVVGPEDDGEYDEADGEHPAADLVHVGRLLQVLPQTADRSPRLALRRLKTAPAQSALRRQGVFPCVCIPTTSWTGEGRRWNPTVFYLPKTALDETHLKYSGFALNYMARFWQMEIDN